MKSGVEGANGSGAFIALRHLVDRRYGFRIWKWKVRSSLSIDSNLLLYRCLRNTDPFSISVL